MQYLTFVVICAIMGIVRAQLKRPNIIFLLADDMGWNDVSFHGSPQIPTPNIDALAANGMILNKHYTAPQCTPSRASLMTGKYPTNTGLQHFVINSGEATALPIEFQTMPQHFKKLGYSTHMVGKWHLGFYKTMYTPTYRGFDSFFGYWNGLMDYYDNTNYETTDIPGINAMWGIDLHNNTETVRDMRGNFSMDVFTKKAVDIIDRHDVSKPLFLYFSSQACHAGNAFQPLQAPPERVARFKHIKDLNRRSYAGIVSSLDDAIGDIFSKLNEKKMLDNTIVVFSSDNGGEVEGEHGGYASNWPLRGMKVYLWEGGVRVPAALWSPLLNIKEPRIATQLMHICDWLPTLYSAAGGNVTDLGKIDGKDMWQTLKDDSPSPRKEIILQIDPYFAMSSLIQGKYKVVNGTYTEGKNFWYGPSGRDMNIESLDEWVWKNGSVVKSILENSGKWLLKTPNTWRQKAIVHCCNESKSSHGHGKHSSPEGRQYCCQSNRKHSSHKKEECHPTKKPCLFDIEEDPCEYRNIAHLYPKIVESMMKRIQYFNRTGFNSIAKSVDPHADPRCHGFAYVPWLDDENVSDCPYLD